MKTVDFLDAVKRRHGLTSDYQLAKRMGWPTQRISLYRHTARELDDDACVQVAGEIDVPPAYVMACIAAARAKSTAIKKHWQEAAKLLKGGTAAALLVTALALSQFAGPRAAHAGERLTSPAIHYAPRRRGGWRRDRRRRRRRIVRTVTAAVERPSHAR